VDQKLTLPPDAEAERLNLLRDYAILDTPAEPVFDRMVSEAARLIGAPISAITLVADERCWFKARHGLSATEMPRRQSLCGYAFRSSGTFIVPDAAADSRFEHLPLVLEAGIRFYVGIPLIVPEGHSLGTLCVLDRVPRNLTAIQIECLQALAGQVVTELVARRRAATSVPAKPAKPKRTVLVVDDEEAVRSLVRVLLERRGAESLLAQDGADAFRKYQEHRNEIAVVLTDMHMPTMSGLELIRALRAGESSPPPVVVMCGLLDDALLTQLSEEKVACVLHKPFSISEIEAVIALLPAPV
jgi:CheY-like chemotaxis protein